MRNIRTILTVMIFAGFLLSGFGAYAQLETDGERTLSPYFFVKSDDPEVDQLPLKSTSVQVNISGVIADVLVTQVYKNEGKKPLEAIYVFPASTRAAVYGMKMTIGERTITAKIAEREDARCQYDDAKQAGKSASLLEQHRPNVFQMNVANILPSDIIKVELRYTELLVPTDTVYEFVYPTVVGPRYTDQKADDTNPWENWVHNPYLHQGEPPTYAFEMAVNLSAGLPIQEVTCSSHKVNINYNGSAFSRVKLDPSEKYGGNRDFILKYRLAGGRIEAGLLLFEGEKENFFLVMVQPPKRVSERQIPPREYIFIVDVSGSMHGFPLDISKKLLKDLIGKLRPTDKFNVLLFAGGSLLMSKQSLPATQENIRHAIAMIERQRGGGGTRLLLALKRALALPKTEGCSRSVVIATDGYVAVEEQAFDLIRNNLGNANMFAFGIGSAVNRHIIEGMARVGMGEPFVITKPEEATEKAKKFRKLIQSPVLTGVNVDFGRFQVYDVEPYSIPDVLAHRPVLVFGKWREKLQGHIEMRGTSGDGPFMARLDVTHVKPLEANSALRYLWARHRITLLADYNRLSPQDERIKEVTSLGLAYNLLTAYTSFIAVDAQVRVVDGKTVTVKQPLPLPQGVCDLAVGNRLYAKSRAQVFAAAPSTVARESAPGKGWLACKDEELSSDKASSEKIYMKVRKIVVSEGLPERSAEGVIKRAMLAINKCYRKTSGQASSLKGEVVLTLVVGPDGRVAKAYMEKGQDTYKDFERCMVKKLKALQFPAKAGRKDVVVKITFVMI
ncbi:MAG: AgmX/PglI C-terminal domain-containing protein [Deltaproteobacteria bacterium]|nr:MAG: AgmX/PglI C-terminal domain-containing protein [Deltaproteobacteria bacterium]